MAWTENGPVSLPPKGLVVFAVIGVIAAGAVSAGLGFEAAWRGGDRSTAGAADAQDDTSQAIVAKPLVELPAEQQQQAAANTAPVARTNAAQDTSDDDEDDDSNDINAKRAAAQAVQSTPSQQGHTIDSILASPDEKPQSPAKPTTDEGAPGAPTKSDVPF